MYLIIFEDGSLYTTNELTEAELEACAEGILDIVHHDERGYHQYSEGEFHYLKPKDQNDN